MSALTTRRRGSRALWTLAAFIAAVLAMTIGTLARAAGGNAALPIQVGRAA